MPSSNYDYEMYATICAQDKGRWDILKCSINNIRFTVPLSQTIVVTASDIADLPGLAARYLGTRFLWYAILHYNGLYDSIADVSVGMTLNIPRLEPLLNALRTSSAGSGNRNSSGNNSNIIAI
jgi:hypothetical protein